MSRQDWWVLVGFGALFLLLGMMLRANTTVGLGQLPQQVQMTSTSQNLSIAADVAFQDHVVYPTGAGTTWNFTLPIITIPQGMLFVLIPPKGVTIPNGATLNVNGIGPIAMTGPCGTMCLAVSASTDGPGMPVNEWMVK